MGQRDRQKSRDKYNDPERQKANNTHKQISRHMLKNRKEVKEKQKEKRGEGMGGNLAETAFDGPPFLWLMEQTNPLSVSVLYLRKAPFPQPQRVVSDCVGQ